MTGEQHSDRRRSTSIKGLYRQARGSGYFIREFRTGDGRFVAAVGDKTTLEALGIKSTTRLRKIPSPSSSAYADTRIDAVRQALDAWRKSKTEPQAMED